MSAPIAAANVCVWTEDWYDGMHYFTSCGNGMSAYENLEPVKDYEWCLYCGKRIELVKLDREIAK